MTPDGWVVIGILMVMFVISVAVMITKGVFVRSASRDNARFKSQFEAFVSALQPGQTGELDGENSEKKAARKFRRAPLYHLYAAGAALAFGRLTLMPCTDAVVMMMKITRST